MTKIKTSELQGAALDWAVAEAVGLSVTRELNGWHQVEEGSICLGWVGVNYRPSTNWSQGGPLIERHEVEIEAGPWSACCGIKTMHGDTILEAACRAIVAAKLGDEVDVPEELA